MRLSLGDMQAMAQARGGRCLSTEYWNTRTKLRWQCGEGHIWEAAPAGLRTYGSWCPQCAFDRLRLKIGDMQTIARERGGECLSERYVNNETKLRWRCAKGHEWHAKPMHIRLGKWCPVCSRDWHRITMAQIHAMAQGRGGVCLSTHYDNDGSKLRWRCANGHEWLLNPSKVKGGAWCRECVRRSRSIADMQVLAQRRGGECLSREYVNTQTKLQWRCARGHEWSTTPAVIIREHWCPQCAILDRIHAKNNWKRRRYQSTDKLDTLPTPTATLYNEADQAVDDASASITRSIK